MYFQDCTVPADRIVGEPGTGLKTALRTLDHTRPTIGAQAVGIAQGALDKAIEYIKDRKQFGSAISSNQGVQFMIADMAMRVEAARTMVYLAAARAERAEPDLSFISAAAKCFASDVAMKVTVDAVQLFGGAGYIHSRLPRGAHDARRQDHSDLRGHQPDSTHGDGPRAAVEDSKNRDRRCAGRTHTAAPADR